MRIEALGPRATSAIPYDEAGDCAIPNRREAKKPSELAGKALTRGRAVQDERDLIQRKVEDPEVGHNILRHSDDGDLAEDIRAGGAARAEKRLRLPFGPF